MVVERVGAKAGIDGLGKAALTAMGFNPAAINAAEAVVNTPGFRANLDALITNMTLAPAGVTTGQSLRN